MREFKIVIMGYYMINTRLIAVGASAVLMLSGCATIDDVKRAQSTADQALSLAQEGKSAAQQAQATADNATVAAQRAQATADSAVSAAAIADSKAEAAGAAAAKTDKTFWQHHERHHRHRKQK